MKQDLKYKKLLNCAKKSRDFAFATKSEHKIGAAIEINSGVWGGCNIESNISGLGICAERAAINHAIVNGQRKFLRLLIYDKKRIFPCGSCLQYLLEFVDDLEIICADDKGYSIYSLKYLLPHGYISKHREEKLKQNL